MLKSAFNPFLPKWLTAEGWLWYKQCRLFALQDDCTTTGFYHIFCSLLQSWLSAWVCFIHLVQLSAGVCPVFIASTDQSRTSLGCWKEVWWHDGCGVDHVMKFSRPSPSVFTYWKRSKTGGIEGLGTRLGNESSKCDALEIIGLRLRILTQN